MPFITVRGGGSFRPFDSNNKWEMAQQMRDEPSPGEAELWNAIRGRVRHGREAIVFNRQQVIRGFIADFYVPKFRAIVEVDGDQHLDDQAYDSDVRRDELFRGWGYSILRVRSRLVLADPDLVREVIEAFLEEVEEGSTCWGGYASRPAVEWRFDQYGLLHRCRRRDGCKVHYLRGPEHWFRITPTLPDTYASCWGGEIGDVDCHDYVDCRESGCAAMVVA